MTTSRHLTGLIAAEKRPLAYIDEIGRIGRIKKYGLTPLSTTRTNNEETSLRIGEILELGEIPRNFRALESCRMNVDCTPVLVLYCISRSSRLSGKGQPDFYAVLCGRPIAEPRLVYPLLNRSSYIWWQAATAAHLDEVTQRLR